MAAVLDRTAEGEVAAAFAAELLPFFFFPTAAAAAVIDAVVGL